MVLKGAISVVNTSVVGVAANNKDKEVVCKNSAPFTNYISEINNRQIIMLKTMM